MFKFRYELNKNGINIIDNLSGKNIDNVIELLNIQHFNYVELSDKYEQLLKEKQKLVKELRRKNGRIYKK